MLIWSFYPKYIEYVVSNDDYMIKDNNISIGCKKDSNLVCSYVLCFSKNILQKSKYHQCNKILLSCKILKFGEEHIFGIIDITNEKYNNLTHLKKQICQFFI